MILAALAATLLWHPPGLAHTSVTTETMLAGYRRALVPFRAHVSHFHIVEGSVTVDATAHALGSDYRVDAVLDGSSYAFGRFEGARWRRTPAGVVRLIESDVQGDALDRWPSAIFGFDQNTCSATGETRVGGALQWVLFCRAPADAPHWFYVDAASGAIVREISREGAHVVTYDFSKDGWSVDGFGGHASVTSDDADRAVAGADLAIPASETNAFASPVGGPLQIPADFDTEDLTVPVSINGHATRFIVDTGTTQTLIDAGTAGRFGLHTSIGHTIAAEVRVGGATARDLPMQTVDIFGGTFAGILGNEFFVGHIVHVDYRNGRIDFLARTTFVPPSNATGMIASFREGMPLVEAEANDTIGERFALDTGSQAILLNDPFGDRAGAHPTGAPFRTTFLEGPVDVRGAGIKALRVGPAYFDHPGILEVQPAEYNLDIPLDGILGNDALKHFEWWYDYDGERLWLRPSR